MACGAQSKTELHPFVGCWETENGLEREGWTVDPSGWLIGYAASRNEAGEVTFFEHMRIESDGALTVTGQDGTQTRFKATETDNETVFRFENPAHDYPQVIVYDRQGDALNAYMALADGSKRVEFNKRACQGS